MANDPEKKLEYEALIYDCANVLRDSAKRPGVKAQGIVLDRDEMKHSKTKAVTDKVDAEIKLLKNKKAQQEQKLSSTDNPDLQRQLAQIENELRQKDNDAYRRQHTKFSTGIDITI